MIFILKWCTVCLLVQTTVRNKMCTGSRVVVGRDLSGVKNKIAVEGSLRMILCPRH